MKLSRFTVLITVSFLISFIFSACDVVGGGLPIVEPTPTPTFDELLEKLGEAIEAAEDLVVCIETKKNTTAYSDFEDMTSAVIVIPSGEKLDSLVMSVEGWVLVEYSGYGGWIQEGDTQLCEPNSVTETSG